MTYERSGKVRIPEWWLALAMPMLETYEGRYTTLAHLASLAGKRVSPWNRSAISKFMLGDVRTIELCNALSVVLEIPSPFHVAESREAAIAMREVASVAPAISIVLEQARQEMRAAVLAVVVREIENSQLDQPSAHDVPLAGYEPRGTDPDRSSRARPRRPPAE